MTGLGIILAIIWLGFAVQREVTVKESRIGYCIGLAAIACGIIGALP